MISRVVVLISLVIICHGDIEHQQHDVPIFEQQWTGDCTIPPASQEAYESLTKELCEKRVELTKLDERNKALQSQLNWQKSVYDEQVLALNQQETLLLENDRVEKSAIEQTCDLKVRLIELKGNSSYECLAKLEDCEKNSNLSVGKGGTFAKNQGIEYVPKNLIKLSTGYYYISEEAHMENWFSAARICRSLGLELVAIETKEEHDAIVKAIANMRDDFWLSGTDLGSDQGAFYWSSTGQSIVQFTEWKPGQPDFFNKREHCIHYNYGRKWNDLHCDAKIRFICELM